MSAENQVTPSPATPEADSGPQEIVFAHEAPQIEAPKDAADVTDVEVKEPATPEPKTEEEPAKADDTTESNRDGKGRFKSVQDRMDEMTRARREAERDAAYWKARASGGVDPTQNPAQPAAPKPPKAEDFQTAEAFQEALIDFRVEQKMTEKLAQRDVEQKAHTEVSQRVADWQARLTEARAAIPDFNAALDASDVLIAPHVSELLIEHEAGARLLHYLAQNPEMGEKLNGMSVPKAATELARVAMGFEVQAKSDAEPKPVEKPTTKAPAPITPLGSGRATAPTLDEMSMEDYVKLRKSQGASWAR